MFKGCSRCYHVVIYGNLCSNLGVIQGRLSNIYYKRLKIFLTSTRPDSLSKQRTWEGGPVVAG
jgi:hypothetical protein